MSAYNGHRDASLWAITSYFNPLSYRRRPANYRIFRDRLSVPLLTVELGFGEKFDLGDGDADILIQLRGGDIMWQKERLLNVALDALPDSCKKVAWIDCDVLFGRKDWPEQASKLLDDLAIVQLFSRIHYLPPDAKTVNGAKAEGHRTSIAAAVASGLDARTCLGMNRQIPHGPYCSGFAWAARREVMQRHRFYDYRIIGNGNGAMACALYDCHDHTINRQRMNGRQIDHYMDWAERYGKDVRSAAGFVEGDIYHLWHGALGDRRHKMRHQHFERFQFDPFEDIALTESSVWRWNSDKPEMHAHVREHFVLRREDG